MYKKNGNYRYSPSDLTRYLDSPFASWMERYAIEFPDDAPVSDETDDLQSLLHQRGFDHEDALEVKLIAQGKSLVKIEGSTNSEKQTKTLDAMQEGIDIIVQARLELGEFAGFADFLVKVPHDNNQASRKQAPSNQAPSKWGDWHYEVWDTKLASRVKPSFIVQLCCYAEMLQNIQGIRPENITVALGNGDMETLKTNDFYYFYQSLKADFLAEQARFDPTKQPNPADSKTWGNWSSLAKEILEKNDHLSLVAGITKGQVKKLNQAGITTVQALADNDISYVKGLNDATFQRLQAQASIQKQTEKDTRTTLSDDQENAFTRPAFKVVKHGEGELVGLALLPPHSPMDVFFDIEGFSLDQGGLEYLWGNTYFDESGKRTFIDFWAHDAEQEKQCFQDFIHWVYDRWQQDSTMHIYHYANYEIAACKKLMGRYGVCEYEVDQLLRNQVFVDLHKVVKGGLLLGTQNYSIKSVELLYRNKRNTEVGNGGDSMVVYEAWRQRNQQGIEGDTWQTSKTLNDIRLYNIDDCDSTQELVDWLREQQQTHGIAYLGKTDVVEPELSEETTQVTKLRDRLLEQAEQQRTNNPEKAMLTENMAWSLEFHRRENKPVFWRLFERLGLTDVELLDDLDCLACCTRTEREPFKPTERGRSLAYEYLFDCTQEFKGSARNYYLLGEENEKGFNKSVEMLREHSDMDNGLIVVKASDAPPQAITLVPNDVVNAAPIPQAIFDVVSHYAQGKFDNKPNAIMDFLMRAKPRIQGKDANNTAIVSSSEPKQRLQDIINAGKNLDNSYLTIQGPPGAGKTFTGKHVIAELVKSGARVGISSNSHKAINNLLLSTAKYCREQNISAQFACNKLTDNELTDYEVSIIGNSQLANHAQASCVLGSTAWGFSRDDMVDQLDYLFIDEAGQVAVANLIAMSRSTKNIILMGDQMQLGQPSQGTHPAESGLSVLDYLLHDTPAIADNMGVFLGVTYRMHSEVNRFISEQIYNGKLTANLNNDKRIIDVPSHYTGQLNQTAGLQFIPVYHEGNTQASDEEVAESKKLAHELLGRTFHTGVEDKTRKISWDDMLFVAPYNHQVSKLKLALGEQAKVGSVDKFQGQEAPIVFLSMCASDANDSPRGLEFLFNKNRINVAISRAQTLAIVVGNPDLGRVSVNQVHQLQQVNLFNAMVHYATKDNK